MRAKFSATATPSSCNISCRICAHHPIGSAVAVKASRPPSQQTWRCWTASTIMHPMRTLLNMMTAVPSLFQQDK